jgi:hypothetical protein
MTRAALHVAALFAELLPGVAGCVFSRGGCEAKRPSDRVEGYL